MRGRLFVAMLTRLLLVLGLLLICLIVAGCTGAQVVTPTPTSAPTIAPSPVSTPAPMPLVEYTGYVYMKLSFEGPLDTPFGETDTLLILDTADTWVDPMDRQGDIVNSVFVINIPWAEYDKLTEGWFAPVPSHIKVTGNLVGYTNESYTPAVKPDSFKKSSPIIKFMSIETL